MVWDLPDLPYCRSQMMLRKKKKRRKLTPGTLHPFQKLQDNRASCASPIALFLLQRTHSSCPKYSLGKMLSNKIVYLRQQHTCLFLTPTLHPNPLLYFSTTPCISKKCRKKSLSQKFIRCFISKTLPLEHLRYVCTFLY